jgi:hypothetical protein
MCLSRYISDFSSPDLIMSSKFRSRIPELSLIIVVSLSVSMERASDLTLVKTRSTDSWILRSSEEKRSPLMRLPSVLATSLYLRDSSKTFTLLKLSALIFDMAVAVVSNLEDSCQVKRITSTKVKSFGASPRSCSYISEALTISPTTLEYRFVCLKSCLLYDSIVNGRFLLI